MNMITKGLIVDTETGGLDSRVNPLLSISLIAFQTSPMQIVDDFHLKILPPPGTLLQIPVDPEATSYTPKIAHLVDEQGNVYACSERGDPLDESLFSRKVIQFGACRVNGFSWETWRGQAVPLDQADASFKKFIDAWFDTAPVAYAHNADFDEKFVRAYFPSTHAAIAQPWLCTMKMYQKYLKDRKEKGSAKLGELARRANSDPSSPAYGTLKGPGIDIISKAHDAAADTKMCFAALQWLATQLSPHAVFPAKVLAPDEHPDD